MRSFDPFAIGKAIYILDVAIDGFVETSQSKQRCGAVIKALSTLLGCRKISRQPFKKRERFGVSTRLKVRAANTEHRFGHSRVPWIVFDYRLPMLPRFDKGTITHVDRCSPHVLGHGLLNQFAAGITCGSVTASDRR